jgi:4-amino-4-deoxy-L-arabinose transferase-like glycosyltransferase
MCESDSCIFIVLERTKSDLLKINWLRGIILLIPIVLVPWAMSHSYHTYFGFPGSDLNLDCGLRDHEIHISWYQS